MEWEPFIQGGRKNLRDALYMPALVAARHNPDLTAKYDAFVAAGKPKKVDLSALMRKLVILANILFNQDRIWVEKRSLIKTDTTKFINDNPLAPTHRVLGRSRCGQLVECGGLWKKQNKETGADYFTLTIRDHAFNANLGIAASQDDASLQAIIPWGPKEAA